MEKIKFGRDNIALTVFVNKDCSRDCAFCSTKQYYNDILMTAGEGVERVNLILSKYKDIKELVFTGGEPMKAIPFMKHLIDVAREVRPDIKVYINTELKELNVDEFYEFLLEKSVDGISISRHGLGPLREKEVQGYEIFGRVTRVRLNHMFRGVKSLPFIESLEPQHNFTINAREDYREITRDDLDKKNLGSLYKQVGVTSCSVCRTYEYLNGNGAVFSYHLGMASGSIERHGYTEVNDVVIKPTGAVMLDWESTPVLSLPEVYTVKLPPVGGPRYATLRGCGPRGTGC